MPSENQIMVARELDFIIKKEPENDEQWYINEAVNVCSGCADKQATIDQLKNDLETKTQKVLELEANAKRMLSAKEIEIQELKIKLKQSSQVPVHDEIFNVERILNHKQVGGKQKFLVKWENYDNRHNSWVNEKDLHCNKLLQQYLKSKKC